MPRRGDSPDFYERSLRRIDEDRRNREMGEPMPAPPSLDAPLPTRRLRRTLLLIAAALVILVLGRAATQSRSPKLAASCTKLALKLSAAEVRTGAVLRWSATGPAGTPITVALDGKAVSRPGIALVKCAASDGFITGATPGRHAVTLVDGRTGTVVASSAVTVTAR